MDGLLFELNKEYPDATCELDYGNEFELLISVILSAQCTDKRVNIVTGELFKIANTPQAFCDMPIECLEQYIRPCGLYKAKAKNIKSCCKALIERFNGVVPNTMEQLITLDGVGRKTANVMLSVAFGKPAIAVDTHVYRVSHRLGLSDGKMPEAVERDLCSAFKEEDYRSAHFLFIHHGRACCHARNPDCGNCVINQYCKYYGSGAKNFSTK